MKKSLLVYGDLAMDIFFFMNPDISQGHDERIDDFHMYPGGSAANCAAIAARLGLPVSILGFIGQDVFGKLIKSNLDKLGISTEGIQVEAGKTGVTLARVGRTGEHHFYSYRGVNSSGFFNDHPGDCFDDQTYLHLSGYSFQEGSSRENALALIRLACEKGVIVSLDPSYLFARDFHQQDPSFMRCIHSLFPNQEEAFLMAGMDQVDQAAHRLLDLGPQLVVIKLGSAGCYVATREAGFHVPAIQGREVVDTTGAGDAFCGGFLFGQAAGFDLRASAVIAAAAASFVISQFGGHEAVFTLNDLSEVLKDHGEPELSAILSKRKARAL